MDIARIKVEFLHRYKAKHGYTLKDKLVTHLPDYAPWASRLAPLRNLRDRIPGLALLSENCSACRKNARCRCGKPTPFSIRLLPFAEKGIAIVGPEPPCLLTMRDEMLVMGPRGAAQMISGQALLLEEFLAREAAAGKLETLKAGLKPVAPENLLRGHCYQKTFGAVSPIIDVLRLIPGTRPELIESSCCGMAGSFGHEVSHYAVSVQMAEFSLLPALRKQPDTIVVANGTSCRHHIRCGAQHEAVHVAVLLARQLQGRRCAASGQGGLRRAAGSDSKNSLFNLPPGITMQKNQASTPAMTDILTVTMNPALDVSTSTDKVMDTHKLRCTAAKLHPGGGGINVARVVHRLGGDCLALYPAGGVNGQLLRQLLDQEQVRGHCIAIGGETRQSFAVHEVSSGHDYRFVLPGPELNPDEWQACLDYVSALNLPPRYLVVSGGLPPGVPDDFYVRLARLARARGSQVVLDTSGPALAAALAEGVHLVKPSLRELRELTGRPLETEQDWRAAAQQIITDGQAQIVALSLGADGALLVTADRALRARSLPVKVESTIGAGDSFVGGLLWALHSHADLEQAFRCGMAAGAAALLTAGTALCQAADVKRMQNEVVVTPA